MPCDEKGTTEDAEVLDLSGPRLERSLEDLDRENDARDTTLRMLRSRASGATDVNTIQMEGRLTATRPTPISMMK
ncbi:hypothetical protein E4U53_006366 [Claviceps sorghi]|nr:hypothetical protein E4U53_006366 [Claviceps sorghi]